MLLEVLLAMWQRGSQTYQAAVAILKPSCSCCDCWQYYHSEPCHSSLGGLQGAQVAAVAGEPHPWLIPLPSARRGCVIPAGKHAVEEWLLPGCIQASLLLFGWSQLMLYALSLSLCLTIELFSHHCESISKATVASPSVTYAVKERVDFKLHSKVKCQKWQKNIAVWGALFGTCGSGSKFLIYFFLKQCYVIHRWSTAWVTMKLSH